MTTIYHIAFKSTHPKIGTPHERKGARYCANGSEFADSADVIH